MFQDYELVVVFFYLHCVDVVPTAGVCRGLVLGVWPFMMAYTSLVITYMLSMSIDLWIVIFALPLVLVSVMCAIPALCCGGRNIVS